MGKMLVEPFEDIKIEAKENGKISVRHKRMEDHETPFLFEECFVKHTGTDKILSAAELRESPELEARIDPTIGARVSDG